MKHIVAGLERNTVNKKYAKKKKILKNAINIFNTKPMGTSFEDLFNFEEMGISV